MSSNATIRTLTGESAVIDVSEALPTQGDLLYALQRERTRILKRTQQGLDADGKSFAPYSPKYAKFRDKRGRKTAPVDLLFTGKMLGSIVAQVDGLQFGTQDVRIGVNDFKRDAATEGRLGIYDSLNAAKADGIGGSNRRKGMPQRDFLRSNEEGLTAMANDIVTRIEARNRRKNKT